MTNVVVVGIIVVVVDIYCFCAIIKEEESQKKEKKNYKKRVFTEVSSSAWPLQRADGRTNAHARVLVCMCVLTPGSKMGERVTFDLIARAGNPRDPGGQRGYDPLVHVRTTR